MKDNFTLSLLNYWRNCLADTEKININLTALKACKEAIEIPRGQIAGGQIDAHRAQELIDVYKNKIAEDNKNKRKKSNRNKDSRGEDDEQEIKDVKVLVCPITAEPMTEHGRYRPGKNKPIRPIWIPARLHQDGHLSPVLDDSPWIPRILLEPVERNSETLGKLETADEFFGIHPFPPRRGGQELGIDWNDIWRYSDEMLKAVTGQTLSSFSRSGYVVTPNSYIVLDILRGTGQSVIQFYDLLRRRIERGRPVPALLKRYTSREAAAPVPLLSEIAQIRKSAEHLGQMSPGFSLYPSQREAIHHVLTMENGEIFAINGPPGNGKTTLIQSVVATLWVEAAIRGQEPPVIVATSTNNQAVTNVIDSLGKTGEKGDESPLSGRWIQDLTSYGLYCPALSRQEAFEFQRSMQLDKNSAYGFYLARVERNGNRADKEVDIEDRNFVDKAEQHFLNRCRLYARREIPDLKSAVSYLHERLVKVAAEIRTGPIIWIEKKKITDEMLSIYGSGGIDEYIRRLRQELETCPGEAREIKQARKGWVEHTNRAPWWIALMDFAPGLMNFLFPRAKNRVAAYNELYFTGIGWTVDCDLTDTGSIQNFFNRREQELREKERSLSAALSRANQDKAKLEQAEREWDGWCARNDLRADPPELLDLMDTKLRYLAFKLATHYWEGRWLIEMKRFDWGSRRSQEQSKQEERWRRYAKLTPCIVVTLHKLEWFFNAFDRSGEDESSQLPLYEFIDLLIIDEAGQVSPDIAGANFSLAKKALVVGDTKQLKPVRALTPGIDRANMKKHGVAISNQDAKTIDLAGFSVSEGKVMLGGNVMRIAQRASRYQRPGAPERGMFLVEHRRCVPEIIAYCNELSYDGRLIPQRESEAGYPLPRMGYAHILGNPQQEGSSRINRIEARAIARWIVKYRQLLESHPDYQNKPYREIVAVITPFKLQEQLIKEELKSQRAPEGIRVGTVHVLQGAECPVILFSPAYGPGDNLYFMNHEENMLNVTVSRAKDSFLVFGDMRILITDDPGDPTSILARYLFAEESNQLIDDEIINIEPPKHKDWAARDGVRYLSSLEDHQTALATGLQRAQREVRIVSPFISHHAIQHDDLTTQIESAVDRGVSVIVYTDPNFNYTEGKIRVLKPQFVEGVRLLRESGAIVKEAHYEHSKVLIVDDDLLIISSFNWLSAVRDSESEYQRSERSLEYSGIGVKKIINEIVGQVERNLLTESHLGEARTAQV